MGLFSSKQLDSLDDLFIDQLQDLYDAEQQVVKALPQSGKQFIAFTDLSRQCLRYSLG